MVKIIYFENALSNDCELRDQNITKTLPQWENVCQGVPRDQPQPGSLFLTRREVEKGDPGNEVGMVIKMFLLFFVGETSAQQWENEEDVASQLTLLGLVGIETVDESVSTRNT